MDELLYIADYRNNTQPHNIMHFKFLLDHNRISLELYKFVKDENEKMKKNLKIK